IGGNDVGLAGDAEECRATAPDVPPCVDKFVAGGVDRISATISAQVPVWSAMIDAVRGKAPKARIVLVGYQTYLRPGGCFPEQPLLARDADYLQSKVDELDDRQKQIAADTGVDYFDTRALSVGHDMCAPPSERYVEGFVPTHRAVPLHPTGPGEAAIGNALANYLG
ncbi:MAG: GDSL-type esterase/lipase family protein, partial [Mycobacterium sp.]